MSQPPPNPVFAPTPDPLTPDRDITHAHFQAGDTVVVHGGWWALGALAGAAQGTTLLAGHVDTHAGPGTFAALHSLPLRARVVVIGANGRTYPYTVVARRTYTQASLPPDLFTRDSDHRLALITCAGAYSPASHSYDRNLVLYATPAAQESRSTTRRR
ncbi:class F sortase [Streptomyces sp. ISL-99]|uniref:class F sortase n=1 Tax=Streptomyces sp. ISL-99 TaxID=2819193 RepID=UPI001BEA6E36|nr:class F sortase [Streptomyces sp. ISL-99]MBT2529970.1 class F sortase [Streptomyces sp. ISL-99]